MRALLEEPAGDGVGLGAYDPLEEVVVAEELDGVDEGLDHGRVEVRLAEGADREAVDEPADLPLADGDDDGVAVGELPVEPLPGHAGVAGDAGHGGGAHPGLGEGGVGGVEDPLDAGGLVATAGRGGGDEVPELLEELLGVGDEAGHQRITTASVSRPCEFGRWR